MEKNKPRTEMEAAIDEIALQETLPINRQEQDEIERSLTEQQWQQELIRQDMDSDTEITDTRTPLQKARKKKENRSDQTEEVTEKGERQHPPTHPDYEKAKHPQTTQITEDQTKSKGNRELRNLGSHNIRGAEETATETLHRRRSIPLQNLEGLQVLRRRSRLGP